MTLRLEDQVCSFDSSKRLKELGVKQDSLFYWTFDNGYTVTKSQVSLFGQPIYSAYTVAELLNMLPNDTELSRRQSNYYICNSNIGSGQQWVHCRQDHDNAVESCARMLIYLIENNLIDVKKVKYG